MKKLMMMAAIAAAGLTANAASDARSAAEYRELADQMLAVSTNRQAWAGIAIRSRFWQLGKRADLAELRLAVDHEFAARGIAAPWTYCVTWPEASALERAHIGFDLPVLAALAAKYGEDMVMSTLCRRGATVEEIVAVADETVKAVAAKKFSPPPADVFAAIQRVAPALVKKCLRRQGKSFVTKDGVNPCAAYMDRLNAAVNAPRLAGLNEWLAEMGVEGRVSVGALPSEEDVAALKEAILSGERPMRWQEGRLLALCLGVEAYNAFVKEYNGD